MAARFIDLGMADTAIRNVHKDLAGPQSGNGQFQYSEWLAGLKENRSLRFLRHNVTFSS
jgi:hypothetical protein